VTWLNQLVEIVWLEWTLRILGVVAVWAVVWWAVHHLGQWVARLGSHVEPAELDQRDLKVVNYLVNTGVILAALILTTALLKLTGLLLGLLTTAGVVGLILGFAVKDVVANFISGAFLLMDQTLVVGDAVEVAGQSGTVKNISLRTTKIVTYDGPVVTLPNSLIANSAVVNYSLAKRRRVRMTFSLMVDQDLERAAQAMLEAARADERVLEDPAPNVVVGDVRDRTVELELICYAAPADWFQLSSDLRKGVVAALQEAGVELAVPVLKNL